MFEYDVFLCFASHDIERVRPIWQRLASSGLRVFWSDETLRNSAGQNFVSAIQHALIGSKDFVLFWSANAASSPWVDEEYQAFFSQCYMRDKKARRLIVLHETPGKQHPLPTFLSQIQAVQSVDHLVSLLGGTDIETLKRRNQELERVVSNLEAEVARLRESSFAPSTSIIAPTVPLAIVAQGTDHGQQTAIRLQILDRSGNSHVLGDPHIKYPGGFGPDPEKRGIKIRHGTLEAFLKWSDLVALVFIHVDDNFSNTIKYNYTVSVELRNKGTQTVEIVADWSMKAGATGLLFGVTNLGDTSIRFTDIVRIEILNSESETA